jgi:hypothetical protein
MTSTTLKPNTKHNPNIIYLKSETLPTNSDKPNSSLMLSKHPRNCVSVTTADCRNGSPVYLFIYLFIGTVMDELQQA